MIKKAFLHTVLTFAYAVALTLKIISNALMGLAEYIALLLEKR